MPQPPTTTARTTTKRAKAQYRKSGPQLAPSEHRRLARAAELDSRAQAIKGREQRKKKAEQARREREEKDREQRLKMGIGVATQMVGYSHTQRIMKGGMEGWLGVGGKRKRTEEAYVEVDKKGGDSFGSNASMDEMLLESLEKEAAEGYAADAEDQEEEVEMAARGGENLENDTHGEPVSRAENVQSEVRDSPRPTKRVKTDISPNESWSEFFSNNTQIEEELSQTSPLPLQKVVSDEAVPVGSQDFEFDSDDLEELDLPRFPKTTNPQIDAKEGVQVRDFAVFKQTSSGSFKLSAPSAPKLPRTYSSSKAMRRSFGRAQPAVAHLTPTIITPSPKMTAHCANFSAAECSFTSEYAPFGLSTQIMLDAVDSGSDTEEEDEEVYSQAIEKVKGEIADRALMPPPPLRVSPRVFKPPARPQGSALFTGKGGLEIYGLSSQIMNDAFDDGEVTEEDEDDGLFSVAIKRALEGKDAAKGLRTPEMDEAESCSTRMKDGYHDLGLSTQMLQDAAFADVEAESI